jgi:hypothetical protein
MLRLPTAAADDQPPAPTERPIAPEYNGWIYQDTNTGTGPRPYRWAPLDLYLGEGYPATIMVCPELLVQLILRGDVRIDATGNRCVTVTTDHLRITGSGTDFSIKFRYRILAVHRAAE